MNINFPHREPAAVAGVVIAEQGRRDQNAVHIDGRIDARGHPYYWVGFGKRLGSSLEGTDIAAIMAGSISVTPLHLNLTHFDTCNRLKDILLG
jgi:5'-nucleotidase